MPKQKKREGGLMSSAGLMRYYESESSKIQFSPRAVLYASIFTAVAVILLNLYFGKFPVGR
ncbi:MAG: preprotein translocase subunit Sec61beta [Euryarchaeota archaeon]|nr:preprotein translocase subunit Sec61beta [Euryarchaeota archaeon]